MTWTDKIAMYVHVRLWSLHVHCIDAWTEKILSIQGSSMHRSSPNLIVRPMSDYFVRLTTMTQLKLFHLLYLKSFFIRRRSLDWLTTLNLCLHQFKIDYNFYFKRFIYRKYINYTFFFCSALRVRAKVKKHLAWWWMKTFFTHWHKIHFIDHHHHRG